MKVIPEMRPDWFLVCLFQTWYHINQLFDIEQFLHLQTTTTAR
jgi:hypothetical protein